MIKLTNIFITSALISFTTYAQSFQVNGTVTEERGQGVPGVSIIIKGTQKGAVTDFDGNYILKSVNKDDILVYSFIGFITQEVPFDGQSTININLEPSLTTLNEVVVTSLGITRAQKSLGYAVQKVGGDQLSEAIETNVVNSLSGKVAGVQINQSGTGIGGTSKVVIRGYSSIEGNNTPLYVIDGIPMLNPQGSGVQFGGFDFGDGISNINANDIESVNVLKGASATALYGSRGQNGVIMITTKKGKVRRGIGVEINSNSTVEQGLVFPEFQNQFGRGSNGNFPINSSGEFNDAIIDSWGPLMRGQTTTPAGEPLVNWTGEQTAYSPQPDNIKDFFRVGHSFTNSIAFSGGNEDTQARLSFAHLKNEGIMRNSNLERLNINLNVNSRLSKNLSFEGKINYIKQDVFNRPNLTLSPDNPMNSLIQMPRNIRLEDLKDFRTETGQPRVYTNGSVTTWQNPYWAVNLNTNNDTRDRVIGFIKLNYQITDWLKVHLRSGTDFYHDFRQNRNATNTIYRVTPDKSFYNEFYGRIEERNTDILFSSFNDINENLSISADIGANARKNTARSLSTTAQGLNIPNFFVIQNALSTITEESGSELKNNSVYGSVRGEYKDYLFIEASARNDWSSSLPADNRSYFYPGISTSFIFTDALNLGGGTLSYGKLRASYAEVGNDTGPARLQTLFSVNGLAHGGQSFGQISPTRAPVDLKPERTKTYEAGLEMSFLNNRISTSATYYHARTENQIIEAPVSNASGFKESLINAGLIVNQGVEVSLNIIPFKNNNLRYETYFNFTKNVSEIKELAPDVEVYDLTNEVYDQFGVAVLAEVGGEFGDIYANQAYLRDPVTGQRIINEQGLPVQDPSGRKKIGNFQPDFLLGWGHRFSYKNFSFSALIDIRKGGDIFSFSNSVAAANGNAFYTRDDRLEWYAGAGGYVAEGITEGGTPNTVEIDPQTYWQNVGGRGSLFAEEFLYDGSFVKLREVTIGYTFPKNFLGDNFIDKMRISLVGRNLFIFYKDTEGFDPEATFNSGNAQGIEAFAFPSTRSMGLNINISL